MTAAPALLPVRSNQRLPVGEQVAHVPALDGLRGLAILLVLLHHFAHGRHHNPAADILFQIFDAGWAGVDLFFVLSGFLITRILLGAKGSDDYYRTFFARRILRIFPLYYSSLAVVFLLAPAIAGPTSSSGNGSPAWLWFYGQNIYTAVYGGGYDPANTWGVRFGNFWSLAVEEHFYLIWPFVVSVLSRRSLIACCLAIIVASPLMRLAATHQGISVDVVYSLTVFRLDGLAMGALLAAIWQKKGLAERFQQGVGLTLAVTGTITAILILTTGGLSRTSVAVHTFGFSLLAVFFASLVIYTVSGTGGPWSRFMQSGIMRMLGRYSYGIYVYHSLLTSWFDRHLGMDMLRAKTGSFAVAIAIHFTVCTGMSIMAAWASWLAFERPILSLKKYFAYKPSVNNIRRESTRLEDTGVTAAGTYHPGRVTREPLQATQGETLT